MSELSGLDLETINVRKGFSLNGKSSVFLEKTKAQRNKRRHSKDHTRLAETVEKIKLQGAKRKSGSSTR